MRLSATRGCTRPSWRPPCSDSIGWAARRRRSARWPRHEATAHWLPRVVALCADHGPYHGSDGIGVRVVRTVAELEAVRAGRDPILAQRYHAPQGRDRKIYVVGGRLFGVKKVFPIRTEQDRRGEPFTPRPELCEIARRCGRAFGIDLYSVDIIESEGKPYVVDMCSIPGCGGVPDASQLLASYLLSAAERAARGQRLSMAGAQA